MAKAALYANDGTKKSEVELPADYFDGSINEGIVHEYVMVALGNQRQGTAKTKSRSEVSGTGKKPWKQKGTGRARSGASTSPIWVRGGKAHGAIPRDYTRKLNKKVKKQALVSALTQKAQENGVHVFESLNLEGPKTKGLASILSKAEIAGKNLILISEPDTNLFLAGRNIPSVKIANVADINALNVVSASNLIFTQSALAQFSKAKEAVSEAA